MSDELIQWPRAKYWDRQWNPIIGCKPCSPACEHCYAAAWANRFNQSFEPHLSSQARPPRTGVVFAGNMTDLFGEWVDVFDTCNYISQCINPNIEAFIWLTKRVGKMCEALEIGQVETDLGAESFESLAGIEFHNHYFGFTAENQSWYNERMNWMREHFPEWANLWISAEPLLGPIDLGLSEAWLKPRWLVVGCESGPNRRPCKIEWVEGIVEQCRTAGVPVFVKQISLNNKCVTDISKFPKHLQIRQVPWAKEGANND